MKYEAGQFLKAPDGTVLEVVYADKEKAVCLKMKKYIEGGYIYQGNSIVVSNVLSDYVKAFELERIPTVKLSGSHRWEPLKGTLNFPMI